MSLVLMTGLGTSQRSGLCASTVSLTFIILYQNPLTAVNCSHPPEKAAAGTWEWNGNFNYGTEVLFTCGPYGNFLDAEGFLYEELTSTCRFCPADLHSPFMMIRKHPFFAAGTGPGRLQLLILVQPLPVSKFHFLRKKPDSSTWRILTTRSLWLPSSLCTTLAFPSK